MHGEAELFQDSGNEAEATFLKELSVSTDQQARTDVPEQADRARPWQWGGVLLGIGLGGFFDGIVLHQILQWHHLVSAVHPPDTLEGLRLNTLADGLFHALTWTFTLLGAFLLWNGLSRQQRPWRTAAFVGTLLFGWGLFNVTDGLIDHLLLGIHHVRPGPGQLAYDLGFLLWGAVMLLVGSRLMRPTA